MTLDPRKMTESAAEGGGGGIGGRFVVAGAESWTGGYTCMACNTWVPWGAAHSCLQAGPATFVNQDVWQMAYFQQIIDLLGKFNELLQGSMRDEAKSVLVRTLNRERGALRDHEDELHNLRVRLAQVEQWAEAKRGFVEGIEAELREHGIDPNAPGGTDDV